jgi:hypothetical protein
VGLALALREAELQPLPVGLALGQWLREGVAEGLALALLALQAVGLLEALRELLEQGEKLRVPAADLLLLGHWEALELALLLWLPLRLPGAVRVREEEGVRVQDWLALTLREALRVGERVEVAAGEVLGSREELLLVLALGLALLQRVGLPLVLALGVPLLQRLGLPLLLLLALALLQLVGAPLLLLLALALLQRVGLWEPEALRLSAGDPLLEGVEE